MGDLAEDHEPTLPALRTEPVSPARGSCSGAGQERVDVGGELGVVLEEEAVRGVRVELETRLIRPRSGTFV
jgi:hypothetical protein